MGASERQLIVVVVERGVRCGRECNVNKFSQIREHVKEKNEEQCIDVLVLRVQEQTVGKERVPVPLMRRSGPTSTTH